MATISKSRIIIILLGLMCLATTCDDTEQYIGEFYVHGSLYYHECDVPKNHIVWIENVVGSSIYDKTSTVCYHDAHLKGTEIERDSLVVSPEQRFMAGKTFIKIYTQSFDCWKNGDSFKSPP